MWGGRFAAKPDETMKAINASIGVDQRMWREDIAGSKAHAAMLGRQNILTQEDQAAIHKGLDDIAAQIEAGNFEFDVELEDIHLNIEARLTAAIGDAGKRLHTGRSRNDQVATDFRMWVKRALDEADDALYGLMRVLVTQADAHHDWIMPGFTHLQTAQPITLGHHLLAYVEMFNRDRSRLIFAIANLDENPLGSAALAGTPYPIDRLQTTASLGSIDPCKTRSTALQAAISRWRRSTLWQLVRCISPASLRRLCYGRQRSFGFLACQINGQQGRRSCLKSEIQMQPNSFAPRQLRLRLMPIV
jgi:argininosuccinate lyase